MLAQLGFPGGDGSITIGTLTHRTRGRARARSETEARAAGCFRGGRRAVCRPSKPHPQGNLGRANWAPQTVPLTPGTEWLVIGRWAGQRYAPHAANEWNPSARSMAPIADANPFDFASSRTGQRTDCRSSLRSSASLAKEAPVRHQSLQSKTEQADRTRRRAPDAKTRGCRPCLVQTQSGSGNSSNSN